MRTAAAFPNMLSKTGWRVWLAATMVVIGLAFLVYAAMLGALYVPTCKSFAFNASGRCAWPAWLAAIGHSLWSAGALFAFVAQRSRARRE